MPHIACQNIFLDSDNTPQAFFHPGPVVPPNAVGASLCGI